MIYLVLVLEGENDFTCINIFAKLPKETAVLFSFAFLDRGRIEIYLKLPMFCFLKKNCVVVNCKQNNNNSHGFRVKSKH